MDIRVTSRTGIETGCSHRGREGLKNVPDSTAQDSHGMGNNMSKRKLACILSGYLGHNQRPVGHLIQGMRTHEFQTHHRVPEHHLATSAVPSFYITEAPCPCSLYLHLFPSSLCQQPEARPSPSKNYGLCDDPCPQTTHENHGSRAKEVSMDWPVRPPQCFTCQQN